MGLLEGCNGASQFRQPHYACAPEKAQLSTAASLRAFVHEFRLAIRPRGTVLHRFRAIDRTLHIIPRPESIFIGLTHGCTCAILIRSPNATEYAEAKPSTRRARNALRPHTSRSLFNQTLFEEEKLMRSLKSFAILGLIAVFAMVLAGCAVPVAVPAPEGGEAAATEAAMPEGEKPTVALMYGVKGDGFYITMEKGARAKAEELGVDFFADGPASWSDALQVPILDAAIATKPDAICIAATDKASLIEPMKRANDAGIHMISVDTYIGETAGDYTGDDLSWMLSYIGSQNVQGGEIACQAIIDSMGGKGKLYISNVKAGVSTTDQRAEGCIKAIDATNGAVTLVGMDYHDDSSAKAAEQTSAVLAANPDLGGVFGTNLFGATGAAQAVANAGLTGVVKVANFDAPESAIQALRDNIVDIVIAQHPYEMGQVCVEYAKAAIDGNMDQIEKRFPTGYTIITRENVDTEESQQAIYSSK
jgi:ribose transport system substrate-binding protein